MAGEVRKVEIPADILDGLLYNINNCYALIMEAKYGDEAKQILEFADLVQEYLDADPDNASDR
jgi:hypothetical protein